MLDQRDVGWGQHDPGWGQHDPAWGVEAPRYWDEPPRRPRPSSSSRRRKRKRRKSGGGLGAFMITLVVLLVLGGGIYWGVGQFQTNQRLKEFMVADYDPGSEGEEIEFTVKPGDDGTDIAVNLLAARVIESRTAFVQECQSRAEACTSIQPGRYKVRLHSPAAVVFAILIDPKNKLATQFTIVEGLTVIQTLRQLAEKTGIPLADFEKAATNLEELGITEDWYTRGSRPSAAAQNKSIEGFLFPDTYQYDPAAKAIDILKMMVSQFFDVAEAIKLKERAKALDIAPYEVLITASIAQAEGKEGDFAKVTRVVYNRLYRANMVLGMDSTENYWLELNGKEMKPSGQLTASELNDPDNPYNTHGKKGLPIGPISNPGRAALEAAANPARGDWLYFVTVDANGTTLFATTYSQHCQNIATAISNGMDLQRC